MSATPRTDFRDDQGALLSASLSRMDRQAWQGQVDGYRKLSKRQRRRAARSLRDTRLGTFLRDDAGHPLGDVGITGRSLREDGQSHLQGWMALVRSDPCAYCGGPAGTADHIEPRSRSVSGIGSANCWVNLAGACASCNESKGSKSMLLWMRDRRPR